MTLKIARTIVFGILAAAAAIAGTVDGKWAFETKTRNQKSGVETDVKVKLVLKTEGSVLKGAVITTNPRRDVTAEITEGSVKGDQIQFVTMNKTRNGDVKFTWTATLTGDELTGTRTREGAKRGVSFTAKRQN